MLFGLDPVLATLLIICIICVCAFEFVNGFHDTANAVATVIYTKSLKPHIAVYLSGFLNFAGVASGLWLGFAVAMKIVNLLPIESLINQNVYQSIAMVLAMLLSSIIWNLGTWYFGIPCSSSHTLIGSIIGVGMAFTFMPEANGSAVNWGEASKIGMSLLISPLFGFAMVIFLMYLMKRFITNQDIFKEPKKTKAPPMWIRIILILTCSGVSFAHGSNDGQKGIGLMMLILIAIVPSYFALNPDKEIIHVKKDIEVISSISNKIDTVRLGSSERKKLNEVKNSIASLNSIIDNYKISDSLTIKDKLNSRKHILVIGSGLDKIVKSGDASISLKEIEELNSTVKKSKKYIEYAPGWVTVLISLSLGIGTMIGWKRIVVTIGEKIGKEHLTYAQGASSELVAATTIALSSGLGLPVSTTHVLSSGIAGSMVANKGMKNLRPETVKSIVLAWVLTLPVTVILSAILFVVLRMILA